MDTGDSCEPCQTSIRSTYRLLRDHLLDLPDDEALVDEPATVRLDEKAPGVYRVDHEDGRHDDRVASLGLIAHELLTGAVRHRRRIIVPV